MGSQHAAWLMLTAMQNGSVQGVRAAVANLDRLIPPGATAMEWERRDLLECLGADAIANRNQGGACRALLEHLAGPDCWPATIQ